MFDLEKDVFTSYDVGGQSKTLLTPANRSGMPKYPILDTSTMFLWNLVRFLWQNVDIWPWPGRNYVIRVHHSVLGPPDTHQSIGIAILPYFRHFNHVFMTSGSISMAKCRYLTLTGTHLRPLTSQGHLGDHRDPYHRMRHDQLHTPRRLNFSIWSSTSFFMQKT